MQIQITIIDNVLSMEVGMDFFLQEGHGLRQNFKNDLVRLSTYSEFPSNSDLSFVRLASEGFVYKGQADLVECSLCGEQFSGWKEIKTLIQKHDTVSPLCKGQPFDSLDIEIEAGDDDFQISVIPEESQEICGRAISQNIQSNISIFASNYQQHEATDGASLQTLGICNVRPRFPEYAIRAVRLSTYRHWGLPQSPELMAQAGFYFTGMYCVLLKIANIFLFN